MFKWDGTDITDKIIKCDIYEAKYNKVKYWVIRNNGYINTGSKESYITCVVRNSKNSVPCLIDELKPIFGLSKIGTHWCKQGGKIRILIQCLQTPDGHVKEEITLNNLNTIIPDKPPPLLLIMQIQEIFTFREILGVSCSYDSSIILREGGGSYYPISYYDPGMLTDDKKVIPGTILDHWFEDTSIDEVVQRILKIRRIDQLAQVLHDLREKIDEVIVRVDRNTVMYKSSIINRITERLQASLQP
jgi:hypothetical protein